MWRGPHADGVALEGNPPTTWSETENIKWKVKLPDSGDCTPIIWGDKIFLQTAVPTEEDKRTPPPKDAGREIFTPMPAVPYNFNVMCLSRETGEVIWEKTATTAKPHEGHHPDSSFASYSPVTDGELIWFNFGSRGLHCYDLDGNHKWSQPLVEMLTLRGFGEGSSPAIAGDAVVVVADHEGQSKIFAFNKKTGEPLWTKDRDQKSAWATPVAVQLGGHWQVITSGLTVRAYDAVNGEVVWQCDGLLPGSLPTPVVGENMVYCMTGFQRYALIAIELGHEGDISKTAVKWTLDKGTPYCGSPLLYNGKLYFVEGNSSRLSCYKALTGEPVFERERLSALKDVYASPVGAAGHVYVADRKGTTVVLKDGDVLEIVATNTLDEGFDASPVVVGDELFLRGENHLYCIAKKQ